MAKRGPNGPWKHVKRTSEGKACTKCEKFLPWSEYYKANIPSCKDGYRYECKDCHRERAASRYQNLDEKEKTRFKKLVKIYRKSLTPQQRTAYKKSYIAKMKAERPEEYEKYKKKRQKQKLEYIKRSPRQRMIRNIRKRLYSVIKLKKGYKPESYSKTIGCKVQELYAYIESKFGKGMSWDNYGEWHIDHIKPICSFDLNSKEDVEKINHYTNLQPLWAKDNIIKGDCYDNETL